MKVFKRLTCILLEIIQKNRFNLTNPSLQFISIFILLQFLLTSTNLYSQSLQFYDVNPSAYPLVKAKFMAFDKDNNQVFLTIQDLTLFENSNNIAISNISCPSNQTVEKLSSVLAIDISESMNLGKPDTFIDIAKSAAKLWVNSLPTNSECAISSFDHQSYINKDFTSDKNKLTEAINNLTPHGGTDYNKGLLDSLSGAMQIAKFGKDKRIIVFLTDGLPQQSTNVSAIVNFALANKISIYSVCLGIAAPAELRTISQSTGAKYYDNISTKEEILKIYAEIYHFASGTKACEITWNSPLECENLSIDAKLEWANLSSNSQFTKPKNALAELEFTPAYTYMENIKDLSISVKAKNANFKVNKITSSNSEFSISPNGFILKKDSSISLNINYLQSSLAYNWTKFTFESDGCPAEYYISAGASKDKPTSNLLEIVSPNGGEKLIGGFDTLIKWKNIPEPENVVISLSTNNGNDWTKLYSNVNGLNYNWKKIPKVKSDSCLLKIQQMPNSAKLDQVLELTGHNDYILDLKWNYNSSYIATSAKDNIIYVWNTKTGNSYTSFGGHAIGISSINWKPNSNILASSGLDNTVNVWDIDQKKNLAVLKSNTKAFNHVTFSPDGQYLAAACSDNNIWIWETSKYTVKWKLKGHSGAVNYIDFDPSSTKLASASSDTSVKIWDLASTNVIYTMRQHTNDVVNVKWSPDAKYLSSSSKDSTAIIWNNLGQFQRRLKGHSFIVYETEWNKSSNMIISKSEDEKCNVWNPFSGDLIKTFPNNVWVSWSPDASKLAVSERSNNIPLKILDANTYKTIWTFPKSTISKTRFMKWDNSGDRIVTNHDNSSQARIWNVNTIPIQEDISDSLFSINYSSLNCNNIDMGKVIVNSSKDSSLADYLINNGKFDSRIDSIYIAGQDATSFSIVSGNAPYRLNKNESKNLEIRFLPSKTGIHFANLNIISNSDTIQKSLIGTGVVIELSIANKIINFGNMAIGNSKDTIVNAAITNKSSQDLEITKIIQLGPNFKYFDVKSGYDSFVLKPNESKTITLNFTPLESGLINGSIGFEYNGVASPAVIQLYGKVDAAPKAQVFSKQRAVSTFYCDKEIQDSIEIHNVGNLALSVSNISFKSSNANFKLIGNYTNFVIAPNSYRNVYFSFVPNTLKNNSADLEIESSDENNPKYITNLNYTREFVDFEVLSKIDFADMCKNETRDTIIEITNNGVDLNLEVLNPNDSIIVAKTLKLNRKKIQVPIRFHAPDTYGNFSSKIILQDTICSNTKEIEIIANISNPNFTIDTLIVYGIPNIEVSAISKIRNLSNRTIHINKEPNISPFKFAKKYFPLILEAKQTKDLEILYKSGKDDSTVVVSNLLANECNAQSNYVLKGYPANLVGALQIGESHGEMFEIIELEIKIQNAVSSFSSLFITQVDADLVYNASMLEAIGKQKTVVMKDERYAKLPISFNLQNIPSDSIVYKQKFKVALGDSIQSDIKLENVKSQSIFGNYVFQIYNSKFNLDGYCIEGGTRLIKANGKTKMTTNLDANNLLIEIELIEKSDIELILVNSLGSIAKRIEIKDLDTGVHSFSMPIDQLAQGAYNLILQSATQRKINRISIIK